MRDLIEHAHEITTQYLGDVLVIHAPAVHFDYCFATEFGQAVMFRRLGLDIAKLVNVVVHKLDRTDARFPGIGQAFAVFFQEVTAFARKYGPATVANSAADNCPAAISATVRCWKVPPETIFRSMGSSGVIP